MKYSEPSNHFARLKLLNRMRKVKPKNSKDKCTSKFNINYKSFNLIYCIKYKRCNKQYIEQTKNPQRKNK